MKETEVQGADLTALVICRLRYIDKRNVKEQKGVRPWLLVTPESSFHVMRVRFRLPGDLDAKGPNNHQTRANEDDDDDYDDDDDDDDNNDDNNDERNDHVRVVDLESNQIKNIRWCDQRNRPNIFWSNQGRAFDCA